MFSFCAIIIFLLWKIDPDTRMVLVSRLRDRQRVASFCNLVILLVSTVGFSWKGENHWDDQGVCDVDKKMFLILMRIRWFVVCFLLCWLDYWLTKTFIFSLLALVTEINFFKEIVHLQWHLYAFIQTVQCSSEVAWMHLHCNYKCTVS